MKLRFLALLLLFAAFTATAQVKKQPAKPKTTTTTKQKPKQPLKKTVVKKPVAKAPVSKERRFEITTNYGVMTGVLSDSTPLHRDNFVKLVNEGFYDSLLFHRVIQGFMLQGGDPNSKNADINTMLGNGSAPGERVPAEFKPYLIHKKGALAAARDNNPAKASSNCQFYIVQGAKIDEEQLKGIESNVKFNNINFTYTPKQKEMYKNIGGTPFLDQGYTVFGSITSGLDVIDKIAAVETRNKGMEDRPLKNVWFKIKMLN